MQINKHREQVNNDKCQQFINGQIIKVFPQSEQMFRHVNR